MLGEQLYENEGCHKDPRWLQGQRSTYKRHGEEQVSAGLGPLSRRAVGLHFGRKQQLEDLQRVIHKFN